jgi:hypothetical protein
MREMIPVPLLWRRAALALGAAFASRRIDALVNASTHAWRSACRHSALLAINNGSADMAEVFVEFDTTIRGAEGTRWGPRACGGIAADGLWEGWIEFTPNDDSVDPVRTPRETAQPNRDDLMYWAQGLTQVYLEGALRRALEPPPRVRHVQSAFSPHFDAPGPRLRASPAATPHAVLNPFDVYLQGEHVLVEELSALDVGRVRDIVVAYGLLDGSVAAGRSREELTAAIIAGVRFPSVGRAQNRGGAAL